MVQLVQAPFVDAAVGGDHIDIHQPGGSTGGGGIAATRPQEEGRWG